MSLIHLLCLLQSRSQLQWQGCVRPRSAIEVLQVALVTPAKAQVNAQAQQFVMEDKSLL